MSFPDLTLANWQDTRDTIHAYAQVIGDVRKQLTPKQKQWWHISLRATAEGLTTLPMLVGHKTVELKFNYFTHELRLRSSIGEEDFISLDGQSVKDFSDELVEILSDVGAEITIKPEFLADDKSRVYNDTAVESFWEALSQIDQMFKAFKAGFRGESSPVQLWPHHFDLAVVWFSGRLIPDQDPTNADYADEQMGFGFSTGDDYIADPYFYITAYPWPDGLIGSPLPAEAYWMTDGLTAAILPYAAPTESDDPYGLVASYLDAAFSAGSNLMQS